MHVPVKVWVESNRDKRELEALVTGAGFRLDDKDPEMIITYGGDGSILHAEAKYPGIPKLPIREKTISSRCESYSIDQIPKVLSKLSEGKYKTYEETKVEASVRGQKIEGLNEVQIHTRMPTHAIRFSFSTDKTIMSEIIGDGIVASTAHGSTAYYRSVGGKPFKKGIRVAFNNIWPQCKPIELGEGKVATFKLLRDRAWLAADNNQNMFDLRPGDMVEIKQSINKARFVKI